MELQVKKTTWVLSTLRKTTANPLFKFLIKLLVEFIHDGRIYQCPCPPSLTS